MIRPSVRTHHIIPGGHDGFHIQIAGEERDDPIRHNFAVLDQDAPKVPDHSRIISYFESRADGHLITTPRDNLRIRLTLQVNLSDY